VTTPYFIFGIFVSFDLWFDFVLFAFSVRRLMASPAFLIAGVPTELGEILKPKSQSKLKNIAEATVRIPSRFKRAEAPPSRRTPRGIRMFGLGGGNK
ncbi:MAG TPA: hypothetical protein VK731_01920, partial [Candidatus Cybelea sp.]|nr:hypothetical protein [Candidatus Cybelea sp.]